MPDGTAAHIDRITIAPDVCNGRPTIRGLRITVATVLGYLAAGDSAAEIIEEFPDLTPEDIAACLDFASRMMEHRYAVHEVR